MIKRASHSLSIVYSTHTQMCMFVFTTSSPHCLTASHIYIYKGPCLAASSIFFGIAHKSPVMALITEAFCCV